MTVLAKETRDLWLWLLHRGGKWTAQEVAQHFGGDSKELFRRLHAMKRRHLVQQFPPDAGSRFNRYGITGTCLVPVGMAVAEVQAC